jgi:RNase P subunit RPR2
MQPFEMTKWLESSYSIPLAKKIMFCEHCCDDSVCEENTSLETKTKLGDTEKAFFWICCDCGNRIKVSYD